MDFDDPKVVIPPSPTVSYRKAYMPSTDAVTSNTTKYRLILTQYQQVPILLSTASSPRNAQLSQLDLVIVNVALGIVCLTILVSDVAADVVNEIIFNAEFDVN